MGKKSKKPVVVAVSGGFDPLHIGHVRMMEAAKKLGDKLIVIVNGDSWLIRKKGFAFMPEKERAEIIFSLKAVDDVYIHHSESYDVSAALKKIHPDIFANGGDRDEKNAKDPKSSLYKDIEMCKKLGIEMVFNVGHGGKVQSSSWLTAKVPVKANGKK